MESTKKNIAVAQQRQKEQYDQKHSKASKFAINTKVLKKDFTRKKRKGGGMDHRWVGPYVITKDVGKGFYSLKHLDSTKVIKRIHGAHLKLYFTPPNSPDDFTNGSTANTTLEGDGNESLTLDSQLPPAHTSTPSSPTLPPPLHFQTNSCSLSSSLLSTPSSSIQSLPASVTSPQLSQKTIPQLFQKPPQSLTTQHSVPTLHCSLSTPLQNQRIGQPTSTISSYHTSSIFPEEVYGFNCAVHASLFFRFIILHIKHCGK